MNPEICAHRAIEGRQSTAAADYLDKKSDRRPEQEASKKAVRKDSRRAA